jgi:hypothetical protein
VGKSRVYDQPGRWVEIGIGYADLFLAKLGLHPWDDPRRSLTIWKNHVRRSVVEMFSTVSSKPDLVRPDESPGSIDHGSIARAAA